MTEKESKIMAKVYDLLDKYSGLMERLPAEGEERDKMLSEMASEFNAVYSASEGHWMNTMYLSLYEYLCRKWAYIAGRKVSK